jgi:psiF repeat
MSIVSRRLWTIVMSLLLATSLTLVTSSAQSSSPSAQDKAKACNDLADKKGLKDQERKDFLQSCLSKAANSGSTPASNASQEDKASACKNLADKKNLTGADRRSFLKDCMNKANSK